MANLQVFLSLRDNGSENQRVHNLAVLQIKGEKILLQTHLDYQDRRTQAMESTMKSNHRDRLA